MTKQDKNLSYLQIHTLTLLVTITVYFVVYYSRLFFYLDEIYMQPFNSDRIILYILFCDLLFYLALYSGYLSLSMNIHFKSSFVKITRDHDFHAAQDSSVDQKMNW